MMQVEVTFGMRDLREWNSVELAVSALADALEHWLVVKELNLTEQPYIVDDETMGEVLSQTDPLPADSFEQPNFDLSRMCSKQVVR